jgi:hypothetical protein
MARGSGDGGGGRRAPAVVAHTLQLRLIMFIVLLLVAAADLLDYRAGAAHLHQEEILQVQAAGNVA